MTSNGFRDRRSWCISRPPRFGFRVEPHGFHRPVGVRPGGMWPAVSRCGGVRSDLRAPFVRQSVSRGCDVLSQTRVARGGVVERRTGSEDRQNHQGPPRTEGYWGRLKALLSSGAAQESNLPSVGLPRLTGFEASVSEVQLRTEAGFRLRFRPSRCAEVR
jgi:hypothetical protein